MPSEIFDDGTPNDSTYWSELSLHGKPATGPGVEPPVCCVSHVGNEIERISEGLVVVRRAQLPKIHYWYAVTPGSSFSRGTTAAETVQPA